MKKKIVFIFILLFLVSGRGFAEEKTVLSITVEGNETVSSQRVLSLLRTRVGETFSKRILNEDVKRLYKTGYFSDITVETKEEKEGIVLTIKLKENLIIGNISIRGNKIFRKSQIREEIPFKVGDFFNEKKLKDAVSAISKLYEKKQIFFTEIKPEVKTEEQKVTIFFHLKEGKRGRVTKIRFEGNKTFSDEKLKRKMRIKERGFLRLGTFKKKALEEDKAKILAFYKGNGFANVQLKEVKVIPDKKKRKLTIVIVIDEGKRFYLGERKLTGNLLFPKGELKKRFFLKTGSFYIESRVNAESNSLRNYYTDRGYLLTKIEVIQRPKPDTSIINITYRIEPGEIISIEEVKIKGNNITKDNVIRRELKVKPGEVFCGKKLRKSIVHLSDLGYFNDIGITTEPGTTADTRNLMITVDEKEKTGLFSFGGGYSTIDKIIGFVGVEQRNFDWRDWPHFVGGGQNINLKAEFGTKKKNFSLSFTNPWIYDKPISFGFDLYAITREWNEYTEARIGGDIRLNRRFRDGLYVTSGMIKSEEIEISDIEAGASPDLKKEEGKNLINSITLGFTRDSRNSRLKPTSGSKNSITVEYAGLGGDKNFTKEILESTFYFSLPRGFVLSQRMQCGIAQQDVPIYERFYAGGANSIRGYEERSVGPRDNLDNPIGGKAIIIENLELTHSLYKDILYWAIFFDAGNVWSRPKNIGLTDLRKGVGAGIRIKVPLFQLPIKIDYGYPLDPEPGEKQKGIVHFTMQWGF